MFTPWSKKMPQIHKSRFCVFYFQRIILSEDRSYFLHFTVETKTQKSNSLDELDFENYLSSWEARHNINVRDSFFFYSNNRLQLNSGSLHRRVKIHVNCMFSLFLKKFHCTQHIIMRTCWCFSVSLAFLTEHKMDYKRVFKT